MEIIDALSLEETWQPFLETKMKRGTLRKAELEDLQKFVNEKEYVGIVDKIQTHLELSTPVMREINKNTSNKKRIVFTFQREENYALKCITFLLKKYDFLFSPNLFSFRSDIGVRGAINQLIGNTGLSKMYTYKADIHDYFNSVDTNKIIQRIKESLQKERKLVCLIENMLNNPYTIWNDSEVTVRKGIMAGVPLAGFLANLYLKEMDEYFMRCGMKYIRYSDDIIILSEDKEEVCTGEKVIKKFLSQKKLMINEKKEIRTLPGESIEFLGFTFCNGKIEISEISMKKIKDKLKRKARAIYRWRVKKNLSGEKAAKAYIRFLNRKFYDNPINGEITWVRWYFPVINDEQKLKSIDEYAIQCIRYLYTGRYGKQNYNLRYSELKELGYRSLVNNYWKFKKGTYKKIGE